jgi:hypothetical protein
MDQGVVILEGEKPPDCTVVEVTPVRQPAPTSAGTGLATHGALGMWKDRTDLPDDPVEASAVLRRKLMR